MKKTIFTTLSIILVLISCSKDPKIIPNKTKIPDSGTKVPSKTTSSKTSDLGITVTSKLTVDADRTNSITQGDTVTFTITVTNNGSSDDTGVEVTNPLPSGLTYGSSISTQQGTYDKGTGIWKIGALANKKTATLTIPMIVKTPTGNVNEFKDIATISKTDIADPKSNNNKASETLDVKTTTNVSHASVKPTPEVGDIDPDYPYKTVKGRMQILDPLFENLPENTRVKNFFTKEQYNKIFPNRGEYFISPFAYANPPFTQTTAYSPTLGKEYYSYENFMIAVNFLTSKGGDYAKLFNEGSPLDMKRELAALLANFKQESQGLRYNAEQFYHPIKDTHNYSGYEGRGPIQLSYAYNYGPFSQFVFGNPNILIKQGTAVPEGNHTYEPVTGEKYEYNGKKYIVGPGAVAVDGRLAWLSALWFVMTPRDSKPSIHNVMIGKWVPSSSDRANGRQAGFGMTINIINGGLECGEGHSKNPAAKNRVKYYNEILGLFKITDPREKKCGRMKSY